MTDVLSDTEADLIDKIDSFIDFLDDTVTNAFAEATNQLRSLVETNDFDQGVIHFGNYHKFNGCVDTLGFIRDKLCELLDDHEYPAPKGERV